MAVSTGPPDVRDITYGEPLVESSVERGWVVAVVDDGGRCELLCSVLLAPDIESRRGVGTTYHKWTSLN